MTTAQASSIKISPVNMESRKKLGLRAGDTVRVWQKIQEKGKMRLQAFEGLVLARKHGNEAGATFTVRRVASGVGVEKIFPLYSPVIDKIEIIKRSKVRRAKLYHIREKAAKEVKHQMRHMTMVDLQTVSDTQEVNKKDLSAEADAKAEEEINKEQEVKPASTDASQGGDEAPKEVAKEEKEVEEKVEAKKSEEVKSA